MNTDGRILILNMMLALTLASAEILAQDSSGMVVASRGDVSIISNGETRPLKRGDFLHEHDEITAGDRSFAVLQFIDGAKVSLRPDSNLIIEQYQYASSGEDTATLKLVSGGLRVVSGAIGNTQPENYRIRTPLALMSVQGVEGSLTLCGDDICEQEGLAEIPE
jgi:hypothetical protein